MSTVQPTSPRPAPGSSPASRRGTGPSVNHVVLLGRLTRDPESRVTAGGASLCHFAVATNRWSAEGEATDFHEVVVWNNGARTLADLCSAHLTKGRLVYLEGRMQTRSWEGADGQRRSRTEVVADDVQFLDAPRRGEASS